MIKSNGQYGYAVHENTVLTFQLGENATPLSRYGYEQNYTEAEKEKAVRNSVMQEGFIMRSGEYGLLSRGIDDNQVGNVVYNIRRNRLLPQLIEKRIKIMFGEGLYLYQPVFDEQGKLTRRYCTIDEVMAWLNSWNDNGITEDYNDLALQILRRYYTFEDYFVRWKFRMGSALPGNTQPPVVGLELVENSRARLATKKNLGQLLTQYTYDDFEYIAVGEWRNLLDYRVYPHLRLGDIAKYNVAISHHANDDVDSLYGRNKTYEGALDWIEGANDNPKFLRSFLKNSLAAKVHIIIPNEWLESKRLQIKSLCEENRKLEKEGKTLFKLNDIEVGTQYSEATLISYTNREIDRATKFMSGTGNQGKAFTTYSYINSKGNPVEWKIMPLDLKYKEYIESLIAFDQRADEVISSALGIDASISNIAKAGIISKSGSDSLYNYIIYQQLLPADEKVCTDAFNMALRVNFPALYRQGYRFGFYRNTPTKTSDTSPNDRLTAE